MAADQLGTMDAGDSFAASIEALLTQATVDGLADLDGLGSDLADALSALSDMELEADADDLVPFILAALEQDSELDQLSFDSYTGGVEVPDDILDSILNSLLLPIEQGVVNILQSFIGWVTSAIDWLLSVVSSYFEGYGTGYFG